MIDLLATRELEAEALVSHVLPIERADEAFALDSSDPDVLQVILEFDRGGAA